MLGQPALCWISFVIRDFEDRYECELSIISLVSWDLRWLPDWYARLRDPNES
jgi:hypothetical protein